MDVCLTNYGHCNYISGKHACIFYDEVRTLLCCLHLFPSYLLNSCSTVVDGCVLIVLCRIPSIMSCSTTASTAPQWTTSSTPVIFLRRPRRLHPAAWWLKSKASSVSPSHLKTLLKSRVHYSGQLVSDTEPAEDIWVIIKHTVGEKQLLL